MSEEQQKIAMFILDDEPEFKRELNSIIELKRNYDHKMTFIKKQIDDLEKEFREEHKKAWDRVQKLIPQKYLEIHNFNEDKDAFNFCPKEGVFSIVKNYKVSPSNGLTRLIETLFS